MALHQGIAQRIDDALEIECELSLRFRERKLGRQMDKGEFDMLDVLYVLGHRDAVVRDEGAGERYVVTGVALDGFTLKVVVAPISGGGIFVVNAWRL